jgi:hypothetical protein
MCNVLERIKKLQWNSHYDFLASQFNKRVLELITTTGFPECAPDFIHYARAFRVRDAITLQVAKTKLNALVLEDLPTEDLIKVFGAYGAL